MVVYTYSIKKDNETIIETIRADNAIKADTEIKNKCPNADIDCIEYEDTEW